MNFDHNLDENTHEVSDHKRPQKNPQRRFLDDTSPTSANPLPVLPSLTHNLIDFPANHHNLRKSNPQYKDFDQTPYMYVPGAQPLPILPIPVIHVDDNPREAELTLTGFMIKLIRNRGGKLDEPTIVKEVQKVIGLLRRSDGTKYDGNLYKIIIGCLTSNKSFVKVDGPLKEWSLDERVAKDFEEKTSAKIRKKGAMKVERYVPPPPSQSEKFEVQKLLTEEEEDDSRRARPLMSIDLRREFEPPLQKRQEITPITPATTPILPSGPLKGTPGRENKKKQKFYGKTKEKYEITAAVLEKLHKAYMSKNDGKNPCKNPFKGIVGQEPMQNLLTKIGGMETALPMLRWYNYFKPILKLGMEKTFEEDGDAESRRETEVIDKAKLKVLKKEMGRIRNLIHNLDAKTEI